MKIEQLYTGCLAEAAYYIESNGEVAIVDPLRDPQPYIDQAKENNATIKYIFETHFHADFVSGHIELAKRTGATIVFGPTAVPNYEAYIAQDNEVFNLGDIEVVLLHTPGHTMESSSYLVRDEKGKDHAILTGDALFIGDVGRPDLAVKSDLSREDLARHLFDSLRNKIMPLADDVIVYPNHGAGSACGKNMSNETFDTLGNQKKVNYALRADMTKEEFVKEVTDGLVAPPQYFPKNAVMNKMGYDTLDHILDKGLVGLSPDEFESLANDQKTLVLDTRSESVFPKGFIKNSLFIGVDGTFAPWVGALIEDLEQPILIVADPGMEEEVLLRLSRVGYDNPIGYLKGGIEAWVNSGRALDQIEEIEPVDFAANYASLSDGTPLDMRKKSEYDSQHIDGIENFPLDFIHKNIDTLDEKRYYLHCAGGYRSVIAASIFKQKGIENVVNIKGGFKALAETSVPLTEFHEPSTLL